MKINKLKFKYQKGLFSWNNSRQSVSLYTVFHFCQSNNIDMIVAFDRKQKFLLPLPYFMISCRSSWRERIRKTNAVGPEKASLSNEEKLVVSVFYLCKVAAQKDGNRTNVYNKHFNHDQSNNNVRTPRRNDVHIFATSTSTILQHIFLCAHVIDAMSSSSSATFDA